ncbi:MAG TPA: hypothetical protein VH877_13015 [Polyangia bacterium]|jgi:hypothetical protein|nr:hypothetical protein [Polyangia bacterium]
MPRKPWTPEQTPDSFWELIEKAGRDRHKLRELLLPLSRGELYDFHVLFGRLASMLMGPPYAAPDATEDAEEDIAEWVVAQGKDYYFDVYKNPEKTPHTLPNKNGIGFVSTVLNVYHHLFGEDLSYA